MSPAEVEARVWQMAYDAVALAWTNLDARNQRTSLLCLDNAEAALRLVPLIRAAVVPVSAKEEA